MSELEALYISWATKNFPRNIFCEGNRAYQQKFLPFKYLGYTVLYSGCLYYFSFM